MGDSYRKHAIIGIGSNSEKKDKQTINRRMRHKIKEILKGDLEEIEESILPIQDEIMDKWDMSKDGKMYIDKNFKDYNKMIRK